MATQGPNATPYDASTFSNTKAWAGSSTGINAALAAFGWVQSSDSNQIDWTNATVGPYQNSSFPNTQNGGNATAGGPWQPYKINTRGDWVGGTTYNWNDVVRSTVGSGGTGNDYILTRAPFIVTNVAVTAGVATITALNNLSAGELVTFPHISSAAFLLNNTYTVLASGLSSSSFQINVQQPSVTTYTSTSEGSGGSSTSPSYATIVVNGSTRPETDTKNYVPYFYEIWKTADSQAYSQTAQTVQYVASSNTLTINTNTTPNRLKAGYNVTITGATNFTQINGTWCINSATSTQLTFVIPTSVSGFSANFGPGTDSFTVTYTLQPIYMKLEYWSANTQPWIRIAFGQGDDGVGNLTGNRFASDVAGAAAGTTNFGYYYSVLTTTSAQSAIDLRTSATASTSSIWRSIWSGANNRFGAVMFYNRNDTNVANGAGGPLFWIVERGIDNTSGGGTVNYIDDYFTVLLGASSSGPLSSSQPVMQRTILRNNPVVNITQVSVDGSNNVTVTYTSPVGYQFQIGAIVEFQQIQYATFLTGQIIRVTAVTSNTFTGTLTTSHAAYGPLGDVGLAAQSTSLAVFTPIAGTGGLCLSDEYICTPRTGTSLSSLLVNGNTAFLPVYPTPGYLGNPMTMAFSVFNSDAGANDTTTTVTMYGSTHTYYQPQGTSTVPISYFGNQASGNMNMYLRWD